VGPSCWLPTSNNSFFLFTLIISKSLLSDFSQNYYNHYLNKIKTHKRGALPMVFAKITAIRTDCYVFVCFLNIFYLKYIKIIFLNFIFNIILSSCWIWELDNKKPSWTDFIAQPSLSYHILKYERISYFKFFPKQVTRQGGDGGLA
jgi:hypothetical protein